MIYDWRKVSGSIELNSLQSPMIGIHDASNSRTVWILWIAILHTNMVSDWLTHLLHVMKCSSTCNFLSFFEVTSFDEKGTLEIEKHTPDE